MSDDNYGGQRSGDNYLDNKGGIHMDRFEAEAVNKGGGSAVDEGINLFAGVFAPFILLGIVGTIIWVAIKQYAFYILPVAVFLFLTNLLPRILGLKKGGIGAGVLLAGMIGCILYGKNIYYPNIVEPSPFTADYLISDAAIHSKRNSGGKELALLPEGERVTVNGVSRDRAEFNISAEDGSTGWIPASAFPADANVLPDDVGGLMKSWIPFIGRHLQSEFARDYMRRGDRDWFNSMEKVAAYLELRPSAVENGEGALYPPNTQNREIYDDTWPGFNAYGLKAAVLNRAVRVNQPFAATINAENRGERKLSALFKKVDKKVFHGDVEMTLRYVLYTPEATMVAINQGDHEFAWYINDSIYNEREYYDSLVLKDLDSGVAFPFLDEISAGAAAGESIFVFPPVTTRHFALVHEKPGSGKIDTVAWDIPEVSIAANAPTMANDPLLAAQRRAANFTGDDTSYMTTNNLRLYPERIPRVLPGNSKDVRAVYPEPLTVIPAGEIVTMLERRSFYSKVGYKDFEGWVNEDFLKH